MKNRREPYPVAEKTHITGLAIEKVWRTGATRKSEITYRKNVNLFKTPTTSVKWREYILKGTETLKRFRTDYSNKELKTLCIISKERISSVRISRVPFNDDRATIIVKHTISVHCPYVALSSCQTYHHIRPIITHASSVSWRKTLQSVVQKNTSKYCMLWKRRTLSTRTYTWYTWASDNEVLIGDLNAKVGTANTGFEEMICAISSALWIKKTKCLWSFV